MKRTLTLLLCSIVLLPLLLAAPIYAQGGDVYVVRPGDTLTGIAAGHGLTTTQLAQANGLSWDAWVYAGQRLQIPGATSGAMTRAPTGGSAGATTEGIYVVQRGESLSSISQRYGLTVDQLAAANGLGRTAWVYAGQRLRIPGQTSSGQRANEASADEAFADEPSVDEASIDEAATPAAVPVNATSGTYIVRPGDTLLRIALSHGLTAQRLAMANGMYANSWVYIGQQLKIPGHGPPAAPAPSGALTSGAPESGALTSGAPAGDTPGAAEGASSDAPTASGETYLVRPGDSLIGIAARHGIGVNQLAAANGLQVRAWVYVGQRLHLPVPSSETGTQIASPSAPQTQPAPTPRPMPTPRAAPQPTPEATGVKWIDINLSEQTLTAYAGEQAVMHAVVSTGTRDTPTVVGTFRIYSKYRSTTMSGPGYYVPNVPHTMFFYAGYSIHGTYWHNNFGTPMSHGCVNLTQADAKWLFEWTPIGTKVVTHY